MEPSRMDSSSFDSVCEEYARATYGPIITRLNEENTRLRAKVFSYDQGKANGLDVGVVMRAIANDPAALDYWNKILILLRLSQ